MVTALGNNQTLQLQSFWDLIQASDESVQRELQELLDAKYSSEKTGAPRTKSVFFSLKGIVKSKGSTEKTSKCLMSF